MPVYPVLEADDSSSALSASAVLSIALLPLSSALRYASTSFCSSGVSSPASFPVRSQSILTCSLFASIMGHTDYAVTQTYSRMAAEYKMLGADIYRLDDIFFTRGY